MPRTTRLLSIAVLTGAAAVPAAPAHADNIHLGARTLARGHDGFDVRQLQRLLTRVGIRTSVDGVFGRQTHRNVHRYERRFDLRVDGRVSRGQARGMYRRAGRRVPRSFGRIWRARTASAPAAGDVRIGFPIAGEVTWGDGFGTRGGRHEGIDLLASCGLPVVATFAGRIVRRASHENAGRYVVLRGRDHDDVFMHLADVDVAKGDEVEAGQRLGTVGRTGNATTCHLHFERWSAPGWYEGGAPVDPEPALRAAYGERD